MDEIIELLRAMGLEPTQENIRRATQAVNDQYFTQGRADPVARDRAAQAGLRRRRAAEVRARPGQVLNTLGEQSLGRLLTGLAPAPGTETEAERRVLGPAADVTPVVGDIKGIMEGYDLAREGHPFLGTGIALASAIPFVPFPGRTVLSAARQARRANIGEEVLERLPAPRETDDVIRATHYGPGAEADFLDVSRQGTGPAAGRETARPDRIPRTHFYTEASPTVNPRLRNQPSVELELPGGQYLQPEEVQSFFDEARSLAGSPDEVPDLAEELMEMRGFDGYVGDNGTLVSFRNHPIPAGATGQGVPSVLRRSREYVERARAEGRPIPEPREMEYLPKDPDLGMRTADLYEELPHAPNDPAVQASYRAFKDETLDQYRYLTEEKGVKFEPWEGEGQPYANSAEMIQDIRENDHLYYFKTEEGFGVGDEAVPDHPMLETVEIDGKEVPFNDLFRAVHDYFGHAAEGVSFGPRGEFNAANVHSAMYSPEARGAMLFETHGQNSWVNFGRQIRREDGTIPQRGDPDYVGLGDRQFAEQKANILPLEMGPPAARVSAPGESLTPTLDAMSDEERLAGLAEVRERSRTSPRRGGGADRRQEQVPFEGPDQRTGDRRQSASPEIDEAEEALRRFVTGDIEARRAAGGDLGGIGSGDPAAAEAAIRERLIGQIEEARGGVGLRVTPDERNFAPGQRLYHGTGTTFDEFDPNRGEFGGVFLSPDPAVASDYAQTRGIGGRGNPQVRPAYVDGDIVDVPEGAPIPGPDEADAVRLPDGQVIVYNPERITPAFEREAGPPPDLMAPLAGAPYVRPSSAYSDRTYGIFNPDAPRLEGSRSVDPLYGERAAPRARTNDFFRALANSAAVRRAFDADVIRGQSLLEGRPWYETGGLLEVAGDEDTFRNWNAVSAAASMQNSVPSEMALASLMNFAGRRGIWDMDQALELYRSHLGMGFDEPIPFLRSGDHFGKGRQAMESGLLLPTSGGDIHYNSGSWKTPSYHQARMGASDAMSTIDTHERRRLWQITQADPRLRGLARESFTDAQLAEAMSEGLVPIRNLPDYQQLSSIYEQGAQRMGLPTASAYQAPRWTGGGVLTNLESNPTRTYQELLADQVLGTAAARGMDESPAGLRRLLGDVLQGNEMLLPGPFRFR